MPPSACVWKPDQGSGADEGVRPTANRISRISDGAIILVAAGRRLKLAPPVVLFIGKSLENILTKNLNIHHTFFNQEDPSHGH
jgi:hypothetical protein